MSMSVSSPMPGGITTRWLLSLLFTAATNACVAGGSNGRISQAVSAPVPEQRRT